MASDLIGGFMKGLGSFIPKDEPGVKLFQSRSEINELHNKVQEIYANIGEKAYPSIKDQEEYRDLIEELNFTKKKLKAAQDELESAKNIKAEQDEKEKESLRSRTCPNCDTLNPEGIKFCQECGTKLNSSSKLKCKECGAEFPTGTRFCGECGSQL